jgi:Ricin-type beta-trefoil lectin domain
MLHRIFRFLLPLLVAAIGHSAQSAMITGGKDINLNNGYQCVEVAGGYTKAGTKIQSWDCWGGFNQQWNFFGGLILGIGSEVNGQGIPPQHSTCMDITGSSAGSLVELNPCNGHASQQWEMRAGQIISVSTSLCLDLGEGFSINGVQLTIQHCSGSLTQQFAIR